MTFWDYVGPMLGRFGSMLGPMLGHLVGFMGFHGGLWGEKIDSNRKLFG